MHSQTHTTTNQTTITRLNCGLSGAFHNKNNRTGSKAAFGQSFSPQCVTLQAFILHIITGKAWTQGYFKTQRRRKADFVSAQTLALDLDEKISVADALREPLIRDYALLVHPSPSSTPAHPKTRVIFLLTEPVTDIKRWEALQRGLIAHCAYLRPDAACKDAARMFYGSDVPGAHINAGAALPLAVAGYLTYAEAQTEYIKRGAAGRAAAAPAMGAGGVLSPELIRAVETALGVAGAPINGEGFTRKAIPCPVKHHEHDGDQPAAFWHPGIHALTCFKCGVTYNTHQVAAALSMDIKAYYRPSATSSSPSAPPSMKQTNRPPAPPPELLNFTPDATCNLRYISQLSPDELLKHRSVLVKSPIGTGKTEAAASLIRRLGEKLGRTPRVLALTHRQALADDLATRLAKSGHIFECYKGLDAIDLRRIDRLVICYDSVWKLATVGDTLPNYDLIIVDEIEQFHQHLGGDTMRGSAPERAYRVLRQLVVQTPRFLGMDAHASDITRRWLRHLTGDVLSVENTYQVDKGELKVHQSKETAIRQAWLMLQENAGVVVIATNSRTTAKQLGRIFRQKLNDDQVRVIHGGNSNQQDTQQFIRHINTEISKLRLLIYSPSLGTGVDITAPVRGVVGVFTQQPLAPADMHQMLGRCRNTAARHVWVQHCEGQNDTDWSDIYRRHEKNALITGLYCAFNEAGILAVNGIQSEMLTLLSKLEARRHHTMNDPRGHFLQLARAEGYRVGFVEGEDATMRDELKRISEVIQAEEKEAILNAEPITHQEMEHLQMQGEATEEVQAGYERFKIEDCIGQTITSTIYDDLHTSAKREQLRRFTELDETEETLRNQDRHEAQQSVLLSKRSHRAMRRKIIREMLTAIWGDDYDLMHTEALSSEQLEARLGSFIKDHRDNLQTYFNWRPGQSEKPAALVRWLLKRVGLKLDSQQVMVDLARFRLYSINPASAEKMMNYAASRREHLARKRAEQAATGGNPPPSSGDYSKRSYKDSSPGTEQPPKVPPDAPQASLDTHSIIF